jgi:hypothetical protein
VNRDSYTRCSIDFGSFKLIEDDLPSRLQPAAVQTPDSTRITILWIAQWISVQLSQSKMIYGPIRMAKLSLSYVFQALVSKFDVLYT